MPWVGIEPWNGILDDGDAAYHMSGCKFDSHSCLNYNKEMVKYEVIFSACKFM